MTGIIYALFLFLFFFLNVCSKRESSTIVSKTKNLTCVKYSIIKTTTI